jgi:hypothetical protein
MSKDDSKPDAPNSSDSSPDKPEAPGASQPAEAASELPAQPPDALTGAKSAEQAFFEDRVPVPETEVDLELMKLPRRPRRRRHPLISAAVILLSLYLMWFVRADFLFFWQPARATDVGDAGKALRDGKLVPNTHVTLTGAPDRKHSLVLEARSGGYESFFRLLQTDSRVFVQQHRETRATDDVVTATHTGQLVRFDGLPYHKGLAAYFAKTMTVAHDLDFDHVARAKRGGPVVQVQDRSGGAVELNPDSLLWVNVAYPEEWLIQFSRRNYTKIEETQQHVAKLGLPIAVDEDASASFFRYVVHAEPDQVPLLIARFRAEELHANVVRRQISYSARWDQLTVKDQTLVINVADPTLPARYLVRTEGETKTLVADKETPVVVPAKAILFITTSTPLKIAPDALVLLGGRAPGDNWYYVALYALLLAFVLLNALTLVQRLRGPKQA